MSSKVSQQQQQQKDQRLIVLVKILPEHQRKANTYTPQIVPKIETEGTLLNSFYEVTVILILNPHKDSTKEENYRPLSLMNIVAKIVNKILANQIQKHTKKIIYHD